MDALASNIVQLADSCAGDIQATLASQTTSQEPQLTSACSALETLQRSVVQLRASIRDAPTKSTTVAAAITESLQSCATTAGTLFKQVSRLDADNVHRTSERFWTVMSVFVGAHVKLFNTYTDILSLPTEDHQNERLNAIVSQEVIHQAAHAVRLASDVPDIFTAENPSHEALPYRPRDVDVPPPYQAGSSPPSHSAATVTVQSVSHESHAISTASASASGTARSRAWAKFTSPIKAVRGHIGNGGPVIPFVDDLCAAAAVGQAKHVESLLAQGAAVDGISAKNDTALGLAAEFNHVEVARVLLQAGARPSTHSPHRTPPVFVAAALGHHELALLLLAHGANVTATDARGQPFLIQLVEDGNHVAMQFLLQHGASAHAKDLLGRTPIVHAVVTNDVSMATILLAFGADPNSRDITGRPLLIQAIANQNGALIRFLLDNGADANCSDITGASALAVACLKHTKKSDTVTLLLRRGARVDSTTVVGVTVLADALGRHRADLARLLLEHGADANATEVTGQPVLLTVVNSKKIVLEDKMELLRMMLENGASPRAQDFVTRETAVEVARRVECQKVVKLLESYEDRL